MPNPAGSTRSVAIVSKSRPLLAAVLLAMAGRAGALEAEGDLETLRVRAEQGQPDALNALANAYAKGQGVPQSFFDALRLYQQAAERGLAAAQFNLGMMHELGRGVAPDVATAFKHYLKAAEQGFAPAQFNVGNMYSNGLGVKQDPFEAALWFRQAADQAVPEAQYNLALAYELGRGVAIQQAAAQRWYRAAAAQHYARAQYNLALMLEEGRGSPADESAAVELYRAAAEQNFPPAQNNLGIMLAEGRGAPANLLDAYAWLTLAVENGAKSLGRDLVAQRLSPAQLAEANGALARLRVQLGIREPGHALATAPMATSAMSASMRPPGVAAPDSVTPLSGQLGAANRSNSERTARSSAGENTAGGLAGIDERRGADDKLQAALQEVKAQLADVQNELAAAHAEIARLKESMPGGERGRTARMAPPQREHAAIEPRLREAQGGLDQATRESSASAKPPGGESPISGIHSPATQSPRRTPSGSGGSPPRPQQTHVVAEGDTLRQISLRYYGTPNRWQAVYEANRELLKRENTLRAGQRLQIP